MVSVLDVQVPKLLSSCRKAISSNYIFIPGNLLKGHVATNTSHHSKLFKVDNDIYICFSSWSKRSKLGKKSEEDKVKLLDMCSAAEANKKLIRHEVRAVR